MSEVELRDCLASVLAQSPDTISTLPVIYRPYEAVRQYLVLTEAQMNELTALQEARKMGAKV